MNPGKLFKNIKRQIFRGFLALIPLYLSYLVIRFLYVNVDQKFASLIESRLGFRLPGLGLALILVLLYLLGWLASNWAGRRLLGLVEKVMEKIPLIKTVYSLGKQLGLALALPEKQVFQQVALVEQFRPGLWSIGFVTGRIRDRRTGENLVKLFIPTAPNVTTGFTVIVSEKDIRLLPWTVQEAMKMILSGGIVGAEELEYSLPGETPLKADH
ncbi:MAG: Transporter [Candidatus Saccharicenans subterraneus]|uniref:Transporter n=1 Tax=Candidatus Saccharicenans subterraneus TaxID=2508984 RepID=A0A3E2BNN0_9BACT|nr:MAG: Transporter [Candidatus Saccharicenans subterraneum]